MKKYILPFCFVFSLFYLLNLNVKAASTNKALLPYEVNSITANENGFVIEGWAMISNLQHFQNASTHSYELVLSSSDQTIRYTSQPSANDQTDTMRVFNKPRCADNATYQEGSVCYYDYQNVGFRFLVPYEDLTEGNYTVSLIVHAHTTQVSQSTTLFYPTHVPVMHEKDGMTYKARSDLQDTSLHVVYDDVLVRISPDKYSEVRTSDNYCGSMYGYRVYFAKNTTYTHVFDRISNGDTTYYKVGTQKATFCSANQNQTKEGSDHYSWIPSNFVDYVGVPLTIEVIANTPPVLTVHEHPTIQIGQAIDPFDYVNALDKEEGDLTDQIILLEGKIEQEAGVYEFVFYVEDSQKAYDIESMFVEVVKENTPPDIFAADKVIYQYTEFDYYEDVSASDFEDGIVDILWYEGEVNVEELGIYYVTYYCMDSEGLISSKTISVMVIRNPREKIRYIDAELPFYEEPIPRNWIYKYPYLFEQLENPRIYEEIHIRL